MSDVTVEVVSNPVSVTVDGDNITVDVVSTPVTVEVGASGPQGIPGATGPAGPAGATGPAGPAGPAGDALAFEYTQSAPLATWVIPVPVAFARRPNVDVFLTSGESVIADVSASSTSVTITFATPVSGSAVLS